MSSDGEAELANATGNRLYREGNVEGAAGAYTSAIQLSSLCTKAKGGGGGGGGGADGDDGGGLKVRSKYYANRAQARMQLKDFEEAAQDCRASVSEDPENAKALVRWGLCEEALSRWQGALQHFERACALLQQGTALRKTALDGMGRAKANAAADRKVAHEEAMPQELVHRGQMLRLSFRELLPTECCPGAWFQLSVGLSNEFGLWRRSDFARPTSVMTETTRGTKPLPASCSSCSCSSSSRPSPPPSSTSPAPFSSCLGELEEALKASSGAVTTAGRLRLVVETRHLEGFGGRSEAGGGPARDSAERMACSCGPQTASTPPIPSVRSSGGGAGEPAHAFAANGGGPSSARATGRKGSLRWVVETDGDSALGPEGKVTLRARFVAAPRNSGCSSVCGVRGAPEERVSENSGGRSGSIGSSVAPRPRSDVSGGATRDQPLLMLLRVSVVEDEAMVLLGRRVVPVLSLPIAVSEAGDDPRTQHTHGSQVGQEVEVRSTEPSALAINAFDAGAISCREVIFQAAPAAAAAAAAAASAGSSQRRRLGGVRGDHSGSGHPDETAPCGRASNDERENGCTEPCSDDVGECVGGDRGCHGGGCRGGGSSGGGSADDGNTAASLEERTVLVAESPGQLGIGGKVWDSAFVLCDYLAKAPISATFAAAAAAAAVGTAPARPPSSSPAAFPRTTADTDDEMICLASAGGGELRATGGPVDNNAEQEEALRQERAGGCLSASVSARSAGGPDPRGNGAEDGAGKGGGGSESAVTPAKLQPRGARAARGIVEGRKVLELGAGTGLVSVCCALLGASAVMATDFYDVTKLIRLNVSLNFSNTSSSSSSSPSPVDSPSSPPPPHPPANSSPRSLLESAEVVSAAGTSATTTARSAAATGTATANATAVSPPTSAAQAPTSPDPAFDRVSASATADGGFGSPLPPVPQLPSPPPRLPPLPPPRVSESRSTAPVTAVSLVWGEKSSEVTGFGAEVVVMSDVVYDPAGYEPLLETLLGVLRPGVIAIMTHRHRHPEDRTFFRRLEQLFHVLEDEEEAQPTRGAGNPSPCQPTLTVTAQAHGDGDPTMACPSKGVVCGGGTLRDNVEESKNGTAGDGDGDAAARAKNTTLCPPRSQGAVDAAIRAGPSSWEETASFGVGQQGAAGGGAAAPAPAAAAAAAAAPAAAAPAAPTAPVAPVAAAASAVDPAAAALVGGKAIAADPEQDRGASSSDSRGGDKCDGADVRIFCFWSRQGNVT